MPLTILSKDSLNKFGSPNACQFLPLPGLKVETGTTVRRMIEGAQYAQSVDRSRAVISSSDPRGEEGRPI